MVAGVAVGACVVIAAIVWTFYAFVATLTAAVAVWVWSLWPPRPRYKRGA